MADILTENAMTASERRANKLYGTSQDRGVPVTKVKVGGNDGAPKKVKLKPKRATQTDSKGGV